MSLARNIHVYYQIVRMFLLQGSVSDPAGGAHNSSPDPLAAVRAASRREGMITNYRNVSHPETTLA